MKLIPYVFFDGAYSLSDSTIMSIFSEMQKHGLDKVVFTNNNMPDGKSFLHFVQEKRNIVHTFWNDEKIAMIAWINDFTSNSAFAHFCCFPHTFGKTSVEMGHECLKYWFGFMHNDGTPILNVLIGRIPGSNHKAIAYAKKCGMTEAGRIPGIRYGDKILDTVFLYITRKDFNNGR